MSKDEVLKQRSASFDAGLRLARAKVAVNKAQNALSAARAEQDVAGVEYEQLTRSAVELESSAIESIAKGEAIKGLELLPVEASDGTQSDTRRL